MNIDTRVITVVLFLLAQAIAGTIYLSKLSAEVERIGNVQAAALQSIEKAIEGLDVMAFRVDSLDDELDYINERNDDIENQHARLFEVLQDSKKQSNYGYE